MKRKFLAVILPLIGCATVVGSGFSAWYFGEANIGEPFADSQTSIAVTDGYIANGLFKVSKKSNAENQLFEDEKTTKLWLDQDGRFDSVYASNYDNYKETGIFFSQEDTETAVKQNGLQWQLTVDYVQAEGEGTPDLKQLEDSGWTVTLTLDIFIEGSLNKYIAVRTDVNDAITIKENGTNGATKTKAFAYKGVSTRNNKKGVLYSQTYTIVGANDSPEDTTDLTSTSRDIVVDSSTTSSGEVVGSHKNSLLVWAKNGATYPLDETGLTECVGKPTNYTDFDAMVNELETENGPQIYFGATITLEDPRL